MGGRSLGGARLGHRKGRVQLMGVWGLRSSTGMVGQLQPPLPLPRALWFFPLPPFPPQSPLPSLFSLPPHTIYLPLGRPGQLRVAPRSWFFSSFLPSSYCDHSKPRSRSIPASRYHGVFSSPLASSHLTPLPPPPLCLSVCASFLPCLFHPSVHPNLPQAGGCPV